MVVDERGGSSAPRDSEYIRPDSQGSKKRSCLHAGASAYARSPRTRQFSRSCRWVCHVGPFRDSLLTRAWVSVRFPPRPPQPRGLPVVSTARHGPLQGGGARAQLPRPRTGEGSTARHRTRARLVGRPPSRCEPVRTPEGAAKATRKSARVTSPRSYQHAPSSQGQRGGYHGAWGGRVTAERDGDIVWPLASAAFPPSPEQRRGCRDPVLPGRAEAWRALPSSVRDRVATRRHRAKRTRPSPRRPPRTPRGGTRGVNFTSPRCVAGT